MENTDNKPNNEAPANETCKENSCCSSSLFSTGEDGKKKISCLVWAILLVVLIGVIGVASSSKKTKEEYISNTKKQASQLRYETDVLKAQAAQKYKAKQTAQEQAKEAAQAQIVNKEQELTNKLQALQTQHAQELKQVQKAFETLRASYNQKLNSTIESFKAQEKAREEQVPNPELNFQLRGLSNVRVQFNKNKDISYIEIIQPEGRGQNKPEGDCYDKSSEKTKYEPKGQFKKYNQWDCDQTSYKGKKEKNNWECDPCPDKYTKDKEDCYSEDKD